VTPVGVKTLHEFSVLRNNVELTQYLSPAPAVVNADCVTLVHNWAVYVVSLDIHQAYKQTRRCLMFGEIFTDFNYVFVLSPMVKEFGKSDNIWQSYRHIVIGCPVF